MADYGHENRKKFVAAVIIISLIILAAVCVMIYGMRQTVRSSLFAERKELLGSLTENSTSIIDSNLEAGQSTLDMIADNAMNHMEEYSDIDEFFADVNSYSSYKDRLFFFVDDKGKYYCSDGEYGKIADITYYTDNSEEKLSYIASLPHLDEQKSYLIFRNRLSSPCCVNTQYGQAQLLYCGYLYDIDSLNNVISSEFAGDNNTFIFDDSNGVMMYKNFGIKLLIDGFNVYPKFEESKILFGGTSEELISACKNRETVVAELDIDGVDYYFSSAPIKHQNWSVAFIIQSQYLDTESGSSFGRLILYITAIVILLGLSLVSVIIAVNRNRLVEKSIKKIKELNIQLEEATNAKTEFLSNMSHDIRTPINGIMGMTTIAKTVKGNPDKTTDCLNKIEDSSKHLLSLINDVLDMTRIEKGKTQIDAKSININRTIDKCLTIINGQLSGRDLNIITEINCDHPMIMGDDLRLRQIFINILGNAVKFTKDGGTIWFRCKELGFDETNVSLSFEIEDTGIGMSPEFLPKVFDSFTQDNAGERSKYVGTGLGMPITKQLTELMGGKVEVESQLGKGSKFTVTIPFEISTQKAEEEEEFGAAESSIRGLHILVAEDNELNMEIAVELLTEAGAIITPAENGQRALELFRDSEPETYDAVLMDIMMPVMNGLDSARAIRALPRNDAKSVPIIAMTANAFDGDIKATKDAGMNAHLSKPIDIKLVIKTIAHYVNNQGGKNR